MVRVEPGVGGVANERRVSKFTMHVSDHTHYQLVVRQGT